MMILILDSNLNDLLCKKSIIHKLDPRIKILSFGIFTAIVFFPKDLFVITALFLISVVLVLLSLLPIRRFFRYNSIFVFTALFMAVASFLSDMFKQKVDLPSITINSLVIFFRILCLIFTNSVLVFTTTTEQIKDALNFFMKPLGFFKINVQEITATITIALKFIPEIANETGNVIISQKTRGANFKDKNLIKKIRAYLKIIPPVIALSVKKAMNLSEALASRGYDPNAPRTQFKKLKFKKYDIIFFIIFMLIIFGVLICNKILKI